MSEPKRFPEFGSLGIRGIANTEITPQLALDLGIARDGDADRMMAVDDQGNFVKGDKMLAFFAIREAKKAIAVPVDASKVIDDLLAGIKIARTKVGDVYVAEELKKIKGEFGGEPSGAWIFPRISLCPEPKIRITVESSNNCDELYRRAEEIVRKAVA